MHPCILSPYSESSDCSEGPEQSLGGSGSPVGRTLPRGGADGARPAGGRRGPAVQPWPPQCPTVPPWQWERGGDCSPPRTGGCREPGWMPHCGEHLLRTGEGALRPSQASVTWQHSICLQFAEVIHCEENHKEWDVCLRAFYLAQNQRCELISPKRC